MSVRRAPFVGAAMACLALAFMLSPAQANHPQMDSGRVIVFDHVGGNAGWVEARLAGQDGGQVASLWVAPYPASSSMWREMTWHADWGKWAGPVQVPEGAPVKFRAMWSGGAMQSSCWFSHPDGAEACGGTGNPTPLDATFAGVRGNEWWVQAQVTPNAGHALDHVEVRIGQDWKPLALQSWGVRQYAASYHIPQGMILQFRAADTNNLSDLSDCYRWIPPANTDATKVTCGGSTTSTTTSTMSTSGGIFDATFTGVKGNAWWVQASVSGNQPIQNVDARINCSEEWRSLTKQSYGWAASFQVPAGSKVDFRATSNVGNSDFSGGYIWPNATPTSAC